MKKEYKIFWLPISITLLFLMSKADLKASSSEYLCWVYYLFFTILAISIIISITYILIKKKYKIFEIIMIDLATATISGIIILISALFIGTDHRINDNVISKGGFFDFKPSSYMYEYKNKFIRGNKKIKCAGELCD